MFFNGIPFQNSVPSNIVRGPEKQRPCVCVPAWESLIFVLPVVRGAQHYHYPVNVKFGWPVFRGARHYPASASRKSGWPIFRGARHYHYLLEYE